MQQLWPQDFLRRSGTLRPERPSILKVQHSSGVSTLIEEQNRLRLHDDAASRQLIEPELNVLCQSREAMQVFAGFWSTRQSLVRRE
jgi:hypothetical protein